MEKKTIQKINVGLIIFLLLFVAVEFKWFREKVSKPPKVAAPVEKIKEEVVIKRWVVREREREGPISDFEKTFIDNPKEDVGANVVSAWRKVSVEATDELTTQLDRDISDLETEVRRNPEDKKAKYKLKISKMMKQLVKGGFDVDKMPPQTRKSQ